MKGTLKLQILQLFTESKSIKKEIESLSQTLIFKPLYLCNSMSLDFKISKFEISNQLDQLDQGGLDQGGLNQEGLDQGGLDQEG